MSEDQAPTRKPDNEPIDRGTGSVQANIQQLMVAAQKYTDEVLSPIRADISRYYNGEPRGDEEEGRSQVVETVLRDAVVDILPSFLKTTHGPDGVVEFVPRRPDQVEAAAQATDYINYIYEVDNKGFLTSLSVVKDGLNKSLGVAKVWYEDSDQSFTARHTGLDPIAIATLQHEDGVTVSEMVRSSVESEDGTPLFDCEVTHEGTEGKFRVVPVPPEELLFNRQARSKDAEGLAVVFAHRRRMFVSEAQRMGFDADVLAPFAAMNNSLDENLETQQRNPSASTLDSDIDTADRTTLRIQIAEIYTRMDVNGDGLAELRRFWAVGDNYQLLDRQIGDADDEMSEIIEAEVGEPVEFVPFALYTPDPEPHTIIGLGMYDYLKQMQDVKTSVLRATLDSLNETLHPRTWAVMGQVEPGDLMNKELGAIIRIKQPGQVGEFVHDFVGREAFQMQDYLDRQIESRTGKSKAASGLDADSLQSTTPTAVAATMGASQDRMEYLVRIYAETFLKDLFGMLLQLVCQHQHDPRFVKLRGRYVDIDPRSWDARMQVVTKVGIGAGTQDQKKAALGLILDKIEGLMASMGPSNPLAGFKEYRDTLSKLVHASGYINDEEFFKPVTKEQADQLAQQIAQQPPPKDPAQMQAETQQQLAQAEMQFRQMELQLKQQEMQMKEVQQQFEQQLALEKMRQDMIMQARELELKYNAQINESQIEQAIKGQQTALDAMSKEKEIALNAIATQHKAQLDAQVELRKAEIKTAAEKEKARMTAPAGGRSKKVTLKRGADNRIESATIEESQHGD